MPMPTCSKKYCLVLGNVFGFFCIFLPVFNSPAWLGNVRPSNATCPRSTLRASLLTIVNAALTGFSGTLIVPAHSLKVPPGISPTRLFPPAAITPIHDIIERTITAVAYHQIVTLRGSLLRQLEGFSAVLFQSDAGFPT